MPTALPSSPAPTDRDLAWRVLRLAIPSATGMLTHTALQLADTFMVGRLGGEALAAVGLGSFGALIAIAVLGSVQVGTQAIAGRRMGEDRPREAGRVLDNALALTFAIGLLATAAVSLGAGLPFLATRDPAVAELATGYLGIRAIGLLPTMAGFAFRGFFFGVGRMRAAMVIMIGVNALNLILNALLIFGAGPIPAMGALGAAWATTIAVTVGAFAWIALARGAELRRRFGTLRLANLDRGVAAGIVRVSAPRVVQALALTSFFAFLALVEQTGTADAAAANIILKVHSLPYHLALGSGIAAATLVAQSLGAGRPDLAERFGRVAMRVGVGATLVVGVVYAALAPQILGAFTDDGTVVAVGVVPFAAVALAHAVDAVAIVYGRALHGAGDTLFVMGAEIVCGFGVFLGLAWLLAVVIEAPGGAVWLAYLAYMVALAGTTAWRFRSGRWKTIRV